MEGLVTARKGTDLDTGRAVLLFPGWPLFLSLFCGDPNTSKLEVTQCLSSLDDVQGFPGVTKIQDNSSPEDKTGQETQFHDLNLAQYTRDDTAATSKAGSSRPFTFRVIRRTDPDARWRHARVVANPRP